MMNLSPSFLSRRIYFSCFLRWLYRFTCLYSEIDKGDWWEGGQWKKDIVSTWELELELAIIVTYHKTDQVAETLSKNVLMKYLPH